MKKRIFLVWIMALFSLALPCWAQSDRATLTGTVTDTTGAVVPGVSVIATNMDTAVASSSVTNDVGIFRVINLPIGRYSLLFKKEGFKTIQRTGITLTISQVAEINVTLDIGAVAQTVEVSAQAPILAHLSQLRTILSEI